MGAVSLDKQLYSESEAARLLRFSPTTLHRWLEGDTRKGRHYPPIIRTEPTGSRYVTWGEFLEAGLIRQYRKIERVPLRELRVFVDLLRDKAGDYPLTNHRPYIGVGRKLLLAAQEQAELDPEFCLVALANGQLVLTPAADAFYRRVEWNGDLATGWKAAGDDSPVRIRPSIRFGRPAVRGISTDVIWEHLEADESHEEVADQFGIGISDVRWAESYENSLRNVRPAA